MDGSRRPLNELLTQFRPGRHPVVFSLAVATSWALAVGAFATVGRLLGPEDERGTWGEVLGAASGNFAIVFVLCLVISLVVWSRERRARR